MMKAPYQPATNYWRAIEVEEVIRYGLPNGHGLDLGCGDGHLMSIILGHVGPRDLVGVDIDSKETELARKRNIYLEVINSSGDQLPFPDNHFDYVFSNSVLEHIPNIDGVLIEVGRILRPNGRFLFTVPSAYFHGCLKGPRFGGNRERYLREIDARCFHLRYWDTSHWTDHLRGAGLRQVHEHEYLSCAQVQRWESIARNTSAPLYRIMGKKKQPIEIQRRMKVRTLRTRLPRFIASLAAGVMDIGDPNYNPLYGCLLVEAMKAT